VARRPGGRGVLLELLPVGREGERDRRRELCDRRRRCAVADSEPGHEKRDPGARARDAGGRGGATRIDLPRLRAVGADLRQGAVAALLDEASVGCRCELSGLRVGDTDDEGARGRPVRAHDRDDGCVIGLGCARPLFRSRLRGPAVESRAARQGRGCDLDWNDDVRPAGQRVVRKGEVCDGTSKHGSEESSQDRRDRQADRRPAALA
jgi:hypothetical protein